MRRASRNASMNERAGRPADRAGEAGDKRDAGNGIARVAAVQAGRGGKGRLVEAEAHADADDRPGERQPAELDREGKATRPAAKTRLVAASTSRPPCWSIMRPASGPRRPESSSAAEKMPKNHTCGGAASAEIGSANTAVR